MGAMKGGSMFTLKELADRVAGGNLTSMAKMLNGTRESSHPRLDENDPDPTAMVSRDQVICLWVMRAGSTVGHRLTRLLGSNPIRR